MAMTLSGSITRTELSLSALALNDDNYSIVEWGPGELTWRRSSVGSPFVDGTYLVNAVKDQMSVSARIRVTGSNKGDCMNKVGTLLRAFEQSSYTLTVIVDGTTFSYACEPADWSWGEGGQFQKFHNEAYKQEIGLMIPRLPNALAGPA